MVYTINIVITIITIMRIMMKKENKNFRREGMFIVTIFLKPQLSKKVSTMNFFAI